LGCADAAAVDGRRGSNVHEVHPWLWQFGHGKPRVGGLTVVETAERMVVKDDTTKQRAAETRQRRRAIRAGSCSRIMFLPFCTSIHGVPVLDPKYTTNLKCYLN
jgi:hypothetical protein